MAQVLAERLPGVTPESAAVIVRGMLAEVTRREGQDRVRLGSRVDENGCWLWQGKPSGAGGYPVSYRHGRPVRVHRVAYESFVGPIPSGLVIDHLCRVRMCVNPEHLEAVTQRENILRGEGRGATHARQTHCLRGHLLPGENLGQQTRPGRVCKTCIRERLAERKDVVNARRRERAAQRRAQVAV